MNELFDLTGKVALVTGASRGLGNAMALGLAKAGADVVAADILAPSETVGRIKELGGESVGVMVDVTKKSDIEDMVGKALEKFGSIDILVNNAGILKMGPTEDFGEEDWIKVISVNLRGQFLCSQAVGRQMIRQKSGNIINIASVAGQFGFPMAAAYDCSKGGVILLTKALAAEWAKYNIRVNAIAPGWFAGTNLSRERLADRTAEEFQQREDRITKLIPMRRRGKVDELHGLLLYLASDDSSYITGQVFTADGGWTAH